MPPLSVAIITAASTRSAERRAERLWAGDLIAARCRSRDDRGGRRRHAGCRAACGERKGGLRPSPVVQTWLSANGR